MLRFQDRILFFHTATLNAPRRPGPSFEGGKLVEGRVVPSPADLAPIKLPITTTCDFPGSRVLETKGIAGGEVIMGANVLRDMAAAVSDIVGGRSELYDSKLKEGRKIALDEMVAEANELGANAVIGVRIDYESVGKTSSMLMVCASGTAVCIETLGG